MLIIYLPAWCCLLSGKQLWQGLPRRWGGPRLQHHVATVAGIQLAASWGNGARQSGTTEPADLK